MKILKDKTGSSLFESLVGFSIVTFVILIFLPMLTQMFSKLTSKQDETEVWRFFQDVAIEETYAPQHRDSNGLSLTSKWSNEQTVQITVTGVEVITVELVYVHK